MTDPDASDEKLMSRLAEGDVSALETLLERHQRSIYRYCCRHLGERSAAADACQEVFLRLLKAAPTYRPETKFSTFLYRIAVNYCMNQSERERVRRRHIVGGSFGEDAVDVEKLQVPATEDPEREVLTEQQHVLLRQAIASLPEPQRAALLLAYYSELDLAQIAAALGCSTGTVKSRLFRARERLRKLLGG